jgi:hypothetical protein
MKVERSCHLPAATAWLTAKHYKVFQIQIEYRFMKTTK